MAKRRRKKQGWTKGQFWTLVISFSIVAAACILITISGQMSKPFLPTWSDIYALLGGDEETVPEGTLQIHAIDVGNADAVLVTTGGKNLLIDAGERDDGDKVVDYLKAQKVDKLDYVIATHADADHIGGMKTVIENMDIDTFIMSFMPEGFEPTTQAYTGMLEALAVKGIAITEAEPGGQYALGDASLHILGPAGNFEDKNNQSVICKVVFGSQRFLFMGDAEVEAEKALLQSGADLTADVLKVGHHGSNTSTTDKLLSAVKPSYALITCGLGNSYGHPDKEVVDRLKEAGVEIYRSDANGNIVLTADGTRITVQTQKG